MIRRVLLPTLVSLMIFSGCAAQRIATVPRPLIIDTNEIHWRMYYEDQFNVYGRAAPPPPDAPHVAWTAYYAERQAHNIREIREEIAHDRDMRSLEESNRQRQEAFDRMNKSMDRSIKVMENTRKSMFRR